MIYVEGNGGKSSLFILLPRRSHHQSVNSKPMRILRAYLLTLEGSTPDKVKTYFFVKYFVFSDRLSNNRSYYSKRTETRMSSKAQSAGEITATPKPNLSSVSINHIHGNSHGSSTFIYRCSSSIQSYHRE